MDEGEKPLARQLVPVALLLASRKNYTDFNWISRQLDMTLRPLSSLAQDLSNSYPDDQGWSRPFDTEVAVPRALAPQVLDLKYKLESRQVGLQFARSNAHSQARERCSLFIGSVSDSFARTA